MWVSYTDNQGEQTTARRSAGAGEIKEINMSDLIDRQQAIDDIWTVSPLASLDREWIDRWLRQLPPAQLAKVATDINVGGKDTISRQEAIDIVTPHDDNRAMRDALEELPPAQPERTPMQELLDVTADRDYWKAQCHSYEMTIDRLTKSAQPERIVRCKDCKYWIPYDWMFSEVWRSKNMADYSEDEIGCNYCDMTMKANDFCSRAERKEVTE